MNVDEAMQSIKKAREVKNPTDTLQVCMETLDNLANYIDEQEKLLKLKARRISSLENELRAYRSSFQKLNEYI